jgi:hypothetical protein
LKDTEFSPIKSRASSVIGKAGDSSNQKSNPSSTTSGNRNFSDLEKE